MVYYGSERWDGPKTLHEMMDIEDEHLMEYVQDYRINLIEPASLEPDDLDKFSTSLKKVLGYIKYSNNKQDLLSFISNNDMTVDVDAARVLNAVTKTHIDIPDKAKEVNMCKAIEDLINDSKAEGRADGMIAGEAKIIIMMHKNGYSAEQIASATSKAVDDVRAILANGEPIPA